MAKNIGITIIILLWTMQTLANYKAKAYKTLDDYLNNRYEDITIKSVEDQMDITKNGTEEHTYFLNTENNDFQEHIRYDWAVEVDSNLFLNCAIALKEKSRQSTPYTLVFFRSAEYMIFRGKYNKNYKGIRTTSANGSNLVPFVGILGAAIITKTTAGSKPSSMPDKLDYLLDLKTHDIIYFNRGILRNYLDNAIVEKDTAAVKFLTALLKARE